MTSFARGALAGVASAAAVAATLAVVTPVHFTGSTAEARGKELWHDAAASTVPAAADTGFAPLPSLAPLVKKVKPAVEGKFASLGTYRLTAGKPCVVTVSNERTTGYVAVDAIQAVAVK